MPTKVRATENRVSHARARDPMTRERPILFSAPMVRAILGGTKTQTRRVVCVPKGWAISRDLSALDVGLVIVSQKRKSVERALKSLRCPYGTSGTPHDQPGDRLWVRETYSPFALNAPCALRDASYVMFVDGAHKYLDGRYAPGLSAYAPGAFDGIKWSPSIHLPRWASRITLEVTDVRVERLQHISDADVLAEGTTIPGHDGRALLRITGKHLPSDYTQKPQRAWTEQDWYRTHFASLWDSINSKRPSCSWKDNPWVWVVSFRRVQP